MKKSLLLLPILLLFFTVPVQAAVNIFACEPEWGALAQHIGTDKVKVHVATTAFQDVHHLNAKPSLIAAMRKADLVLCSGASLEIGWLPLLLERAGSKQVQPGGVGNLMASDHVKRIGERDHIDRSMGDVHPEGNPHVHLNPHNLIIIAKELGGLLAQIDTEHAAFYQKQTNDFVTRWQFNIQRWEARATKLRGLNLVVHHDAWVYLSDWLGLNVVASLEPKPGIPPSISHLETVLTKAKISNVKAIIRAPHESKNASEWLAEKSGIPALMLPFTVGGSDKAQSLETLFEETLRLLEGAADA